ncbi:MAG TPA: phospholipase D-like domain-containing protein [Acidimicrobiia bacterium]|nr:phospholipase D-like domain-containing protein [Acidimicrobiia bacterium]
MTDTRSDPLRRALEAFAGVVFTDRNSVNRLRNGIEIFPAMLRAIRLARRRIDFVTFVYWTGDIASQTAYALAERARAGVEVNVLLDAVGAAQMADRLVDVMTDAGVEVRWFRPVVRWKVWETDHRTHRKLLVVDDEVAFTGGVGVAEEWEGDARNQTEWRDTHFEIRGPAVDALRSAFLSDWRDTEGKMFEDGSIPERPAPAGDTVLGVVDGSAQIELNTAGRVLECIVAFAERRLWIATPYFNPTKRLTQLLTRAAGRGVEVRLMIPGRHIDKRVSLISAKEQAVELLDAGVRLHRFRPSMFHVKTVIADETLTMFGSVNFNERSLYKDEEVGVVAIDAQLNERLAADYLDDLDRCDTVTDRTRLDRSWSEYAAGKATKVLESEL